MGVSTIAGGTVVQVRFGPAWPGPASGQRGGHRGGALDAEMILTAPIGPDCGPDSAAARPSRTPTPGICAQAETI